MARSYTVCAHDAREAIDRALAGGEPVSGVATRYGLSWDAVGRPDVFAYFGGHTYPLSQCSVSVQRGSN